MRSASDPGSSDPSDSQAREEGLQLIGLFFVNFSTFVSELQEGVHRCIGTPDAHANRVIWALLHFTEADRLRKVFFAATAIVRTPDEAEHKIRKSLNKRCQQLIEHRNQMAHGDWSMFQATGAGTNEPDAETSYEPTLLMTEAHQVGLEDSIVIGSRDQLRELADEAREVASLVAAYTTALFVPSWHAPMRSALDRLGFEDGRLVERDVGLG